jgi:hypothetical protein
MMLRRTAIQALPRDVYLPFLPPSDILAVNIGVKPVLLNQVLLDGVVKKFPSMGTSTGLN